MRTPERLRIDKDGFMSAPTDGAEEYFPGIEIEINLDYFKDNELPGGSHDIRLRPDYADEVLRRLIALWNLHIGIPTEGIEIELQPKEQYPDIDKREKYPRIKSANPYASNAGYVDSRNTGPDGGYVVIYIAAEQAVDVGKNKYLLVCETHNVNLGVKGKGDAKFYMRHPHYFCEECGKIMVAAKMTDIYGNKAKGQHKSGD